MTKDGVLIIDKPEGMSSARVVACIKHMLKADKAGHSGTLDPFATGVLVCCINRATRLNQFFLHDTKSYLAELHLGVETDTQDSTGAILSVQSLPVDLETKLERILSEFTGEIHQIPPSFSALKHQGVPLYQLARKGIHIQKPPRTLQISRIQIMDVRLPRIRLEIDCSAGTYIRTLASDMGKKLGCCAHLHSLRRLSSSGFSLEQAISIDTLRTVASTGQVSSVMISMNDALSGMKPVIADNTLTDKLRYGNILTGADLPDSGNRSQLMKIVDSNLNLLAVLRYDPIRDRFEYACNLT
ncbi:MAG: tRNA pseudouridine(55) synthase TruB [Desulfatirhabdiaceae bacterium]